MFIKSNNKIILARININKVCYYIPKEYKNNYCIEFYFSDLDSENGSSYSVGCRWKYESEKEMEEDLIMIDKITCDLK